MKEQGTPTYEFNIRRIPKDEEKLEESNKKEPSIPAPTKDQEQEKSTETDQTISNSRSLTAGGFFRTASGVLSFVSSIAATHLADEVICRQNGKNSYWAEVELPIEKVAHIIVMAGGRPFTNLDNQWLATNISGEIPTINQRETLDLTHWNQIELSNLLTSTTLIRCKIIETSELQVIAPPSLSRWILRRATSLGVNVGITLAMKQPLADSLPDNKTKETGAILIRLYKEKGRIPPSLLRAIADLPYTTVARSIGLSSNRLLVDMNYKPPLSESLLGSMIPDQEKWLLGSPDNGHWRLFLQGSEIDGSTLLKAPTLEEIELHTEEKPTLPTTIPVRIIQKRQQSSAIDAVLLDDQELDWFRLYMANRPTQEATFILPGAGKHLLTAPSGLYETIPFGIPLIHLKPGGLFIEKGLGFYPALPEGARQQAFQLKKGSVVAITEEKIYRFDQDNILPSWAIWLGESPSIQDGVSIKMQKVLASLDKTLIKKETQKENKPGKNSLLDLMRKSIPFISPNINDDNIKRENSLQQAQLEELEGHYEKAADIMRKLGEMKQAGRLYEKAANDSDELS